MARVRVSRHGNHAGVRANGEGSRHIIHTFGVPNPADGSFPYGGVLPDGEGNLYGTAVFGGTAGDGIVYKIDSTGRETVLHNFTGPDGSEPEAGVIRDSEGNLYGTTRVGGTANAGVVFKVDPSGNETVLHSFTGGDDGNSPYAGVIRDSAGNLYGTTGSGGAGCPSPGCGVVYKLDTARNLTVLYAFTGGADGGFPTGSLTGDSAGNLYGTTNGGGNTCNCGVVFKLDRSGNETVLYTFTGTDGDGPQAGVIRDSAGNLYGTTDFGGTDGYGVVYKVDASGRETVLYDFTDGADGANPYAGVIRDSAGNLYGTTLYGGNVAACPATFFTPAGCGVVFKLDTAGNETALYSFTGGADGSVPVAGVIRNPAGILLRDNGTGRDQRSRRSIRVQTAVTAQCARNSWEQVNRYGFGGEDGKGVLVRMSRETGGGFSRSRIS